MAELGRRRPQLPWARTHPPERPRPGGSLSLIPCRDPAGRRDAANFVNPCASMSAFASKNWSTSRTPERCKPTTMSASATRISPCRLRSNDICFSSRRCAPSPRRGSSPQCERPTGLGASWLRTTSSRKKPAPHATCRCRSEGRASPHTHTHHKSALDSSRVGQDLRQVPCRGARRAGELPRGAIDLGAEGGAARLKSPRPVPGRSADPPNRRGNERGAGIRCHR